MELSISFVGSFLVSAKASMGSLLYNQRGVHQKHWIQDVFYLNLQVMQPDPVHIYAIFCFYIF